jgi:hypothetical protein
MTVKPFSNLIFRILSEKSFSEEEKKFDSEERGKQMRRREKKKVRIFDIFCNPDLGK